MARPGVVATLAATTVAATVSGAPSTAHSLVTRRPLLDTVRAAATLVTGPAPGGGAPAPTLRTLAAGGVVHGAVSLLWGTVLAQVLPPGRRAVWGAVAGVAIHVIDLGLVARLPRLRAMRALPQLPQLGDHIAFGVTVGLVLDALDHAGPAPSTGRATGDPTEVADQATSSRAFG